MIIAIEGVNGAGKTIQTELLVQRLKKELSTTVTVVSLLDPGVTRTHPVYEKIRQLARFSDWENERTRLLLYMAARCELLATIARLQRECAAEVVMVLDRFTPSYYVYSDVPGGFSNEQVEALLRMCEAPDPDVVVYLRIAPGLALERCVHASGATQVDKYEAGGLNELRALGARYDRLLRPDCVGMACTGKHVIATSVDTGTRSAEDIHKEIWTKVTRLGCVRTLLEK